MAYPELVKTNHEFGPRPTGKREQPQAKLNCQTSTIPSRTIQRFSYHAKTPTSCKRLLRTTLFSLLAAMMPGDLFFTQTQKLYCVVVM